MRLLTEEDDTVIKTESHSAISSASPSARHLQYNIHRNKHFHTSCFRITPLLLELIPKICWTSCSFYYNRIWIIESYHFHTLKFCLSHQVENIRRCLERSMRSMVCVTETGRELLHDPFFLLVWDSWSWQRCIRFRMDRNSPIFCGLSFNSSFFSGISAFLFHVNFFSLFPFPPHHPRVCASYTYLGLPGIS